MKRYITITCITITAYVAMYAAVWPQNSENEVIPVKQEKPVISADVAATQEELMQIIFSADTQSPGPTETEESTTEKEQASSPPDEAILEPEATGTPEPTSTPSSAPKPTSSSAPPSSDPKPGTIAVIDGNRCMWIPGFGWVKDEGSGAQGTIVGSPGDELTGNKVGQMGGGTIVDGKGDINKMVGIMGEDDTLPSEKFTPAPGSKAVIDGKPSVWIPGFGWIEDNGGGNVGTVAEDMYENGHKIGIMD
ncbi:MAG: hypothetical protein QHH10_02505 [Peptococcaceae bacterium]|jgi:hypothetical protein|nr:hypothetical protein [Peptococcaceae bacterium]MDH7524171.1 hypothetical protein [Peptococcaceae bacterium]